MHDNNRFSPWLAYSQRVALTGLTVLLLACGGGGVGGGVADIRVTATDPVDRSSGAIVSTDIIATFSVSMDASTIDTSTFSLFDASGQLIGSVSYDDATMTATFSPDLDLFSDTSYTAVLSGKIRTSSGVPLGSDFAWVFATAPFIVRVSVDADGVGANAVSGLAASNGNGRFVAFESTATNLTDVPTTTGRRNIFLKDTQAGTVVLVSADESGIEADRDSFNPTVSSDGRFVAFESAARNLDPPKTSSLTQVFLKDAETGTVTLVSADASGIDADTESGNPSISGDGRFVAFESAASNLDPAKISSVTQIFLKDMDPAGTGTPVDTGPVSLVSATDNGVEADTDSFNPSVSGDGRLVAFESRASNLATAAASGVTQVFLKDTQPSGAGTLPVILVSANGGGIEADTASFDPSVSDNGRFVAFESAAGNLDPAKLSSVTQIFLKDTDPAGTGTPMDTGPVILASATGNGDEADTASFNPSVSEDGRFVAFQSAASNLDPLKPTTSRTQVFLKDTDPSGTGTPANTGPVTLISADTGGIEADTDSGNSSLSDDGRYVSFGSRAGNLVPGDFNSVGDIYRGLNDLF